MKILSDEEIGNLEWESTDLDMLCIELLKEKHPKEFEATLQAQIKDTLRQVRELLDGIEKSCNCGSPFCPADTWDGAIQTMKALLEG